MTPPAEPPLQPRLTHARFRDALLRKHGYAIHARPRCGPVLWERGGKVYREREALADVQRREDETA